MWYTRSKYYVHVCGLCLLLAHSNKSTGQCTFNIRLYDIYNTHLETVHIDETSFVISGWTLDTTDACQRRIQGSPIMFRMPTIEST